MKRTLILVSVGLATLISVAKADDTSMLLRLKSGSSFPTDNGDVSHFTPLALDWAYTGVSGWALGIELVRATGSHAVYDVSGVNQVELSLSKTEYITLATFQRGFTFGNARIFAGVKAGALFYSDSTSLASGPVAYVLPTGHSKTVFAGGPAIDIDLPLKGAFFVNVGGDYLFSQNTYQLGSLYVGLGLDW